MEVNYNKEKLDIIKKLTAVCHKWEMDESDKMTMTLEVDDNFMFALYGAIRQLKEQPSAEKEIINVLQSFRKSYFIQNEIILEEKTNAWFNIKNCQDALDVRAKVLECLSRAAFKAMPYRRDKSNEEFQDKVRADLNEYLGTQFTREEMGLIYIKLGNGIRHNLTREFIQSGYDLSLLSEKEMDMER